MSHQPKYTQRIQPLWDINPTIPVGSDYLGPNAGFAVEDDWFYHRFTASLNAHNYQCGNGSNMRVAAYRSNSVAKRTKTLNPWSETRTIWASYIQVILSCPECKAYVTSPSYRVYERFLTFVKHYSCVSIDFLLILRAFEGTSSMDAFLETLYCIDHLAALVPDTLCLFVNIWWTIQMICEASLWLQRRVDDPNGFVSFCPAPVGSTICYTDYKVLYKPGAHCRGLLLSQKFAISAVMKNGVVAVMRKVFTFNPEYWPGRKKGLANIKVCRTDKTITIGPFHIVDAKPTDEVVLCDIFIDSSTREGLPMPDSLSDQ